ncbi:hypothetical protein [Lactobacillus psittaci]|uniref:RibT protein n=1 Tax=Lactobacillus psittaci DSM 15354 TaxID=1122152 RepID=A0A0R1S3B6_9LACO|nr:hypothetical protein [Lactobacillus psittaci]KRL63559.1 RibT protein [Lactobacillus psittaci DSM 15354]
MLVTYKKDYEKIAMGLLSFLPDLKNLDNLKEEMRLYDEDCEFKLYLYRENSSDFIGVVGIQVLPDFIMIRYLSLAPGFRSQKTQEQVLQNLQEEYPDKKLTALPKYNYLFKKDEN